MLEKIRTAGKRVAIGLPVALSLAVGAPEGTSEAYTSPSLTREAPSLHFERNDGQLDARVKFLARGRDYTLFLTPAAAVLGTTVAPGPGSAPVEVVLEQRLVGAEAAPALVGLDLLPGRSHYFIGREPARWQRDIPHYRRVKYVGVYPGIDLIYYGAEGTLEYDFVVAPGADWTAIRLSFAGADRIELDPAGDLVVGVGPSSFRLPKPVAYQTVETGRRPVPGRFVLGAGRTVGFVIGGYDPRRALIIDPRLHYSTLLGGDGLDYGRDIARDRDGNVYITGQSRSTDFPLQNPVRDSFGGARDAFVAKFNPTLTTLLYSSYLGGSAFERGHGIALDPDGNAYVTGFTQSINFPTTPGAFDRTCGTDGFCNPTATGTLFLHPDAFVVKLDPSGALLYSTYLGDSESDVGQAIAVDALGSAYLTGWTQSRNFPSTPGVFQPACAGGNPLSGFCPRDAFVTRLNPAGNDLVYSTFLGGTSRDETYDIALNPEPGLASPVYLTGFTQSTRDFPTTPGAFQRDSSGNTSGDAFVTKLNALGKALEYSTYLGGTDYDDPRSIAVDGLGHAYVLGSTASADFPTTSGAFDTSCGSDGDCDFTGMFRYVDAFVTKLNPAGTGLVYSTYLGGSRIEFAGGIFVDGTFHAYVTGETTSSDFPTANAVQAVNQGGAEAFVTKLNPGGTALVYSTYFGGYGSDHGNGIAVDAKGNAYFTGLAGPAFPTTFGAFQTTLGGTSGDAYVARIGERFVLPPFDVLVVVALAMILAVSVIVIVGLALRRRLRVAGSGPPGPPVDQSP